MLDLVGKRRLVSHAPASCNIYLHNDRCLHYHMIFTIPVFTTIVFLSHYNPYAFTILSPTPSPDQ